MYTVIWRRGVSAGKSEDANRKISTAVFRINGGRHKPIHLPRPLVRLQEWHSGYPQRREKNTQKPWWFKNESIKGRSHEVRGSNVPSLVIAWIIVRAFAGTTTSATSIATKKPLAYIACCRLTNAEQSGRSKVYRSFISRMLRYLFNFCGPNLLPIALPVHLLRLVTQSPSEQPTQFVS
ncbi:hypothetical protein BDR04DRAFT_1119681 [Suillus decipiens]|nr:hypothetical protein BDR04DRAFT_1119681 [Suillus decipiens]